MLLCSTKIWPTNLFILTRNAWNRPWVSLPPTAESPCLVYVLVSGLFGCLWCLAGRLFLLSTLLANEILFVLQRESQLPRHSFVHYPPWQIIALLPAMPFVSHLACFRFGSCHYPRRLPLLCPFHLSTSTMTSTGSLWTTPPMAKAFVSYLFYDMTPSISAVIKHKLSGYAS